MSGLRGALPGAAGSGGGVGQSTETDGWPQAPACQLDGSTDRPRKGPESPRGGGRGRREGRSQAAERGVEPLALGSSGRLARGGGGGRPGARMEILHLLAEAEGQLDKPARCPSRCQPAQETACPGEGRGGVRAYTGKAGKPGKTSPGSF